jgi:hypothetical protein
MILIHNSLLPTAVVAKRSPKTDDANHRHIFIVFFFIEGTYQPNLKSLIVIVSLNQP